MEEWGKAQYHLNFGMRVFDDWWKGSKVSDRILKRGWLHQPFGNNRSPSMGMLMEVGGGYQSCFHLA